MQKLAVFAALGLATGPWSAPAIAQTNGPAASGPAAYSDAVPLDASTAGYYRLVIKAENLSAANLCPTSNQQRSEWLKATGDVWAWAIKQKQEWSAGLQLSYGNIPATAFSAADYRSDLSKKFVTVRQDGKDLNKCKMASADMTYTRSPLFPFGSEADSYATVQFLWWYNKSVDSQNIQNIFSYATLPLQLIPGVTAPLSQKIASVGAQGVAKYIAQSGPPLEAVVNINPLLAGQNGAVAYLAPDGAKNAATAARVVVSIETVGSMFVDGSAYRDMSGFKHDKIVDKPIKAQDGVQRPLSAYIATETPALGLMQKAKATETISAHCETVDSELQAKLKLSPVDSAVFLFYVVKGMGELNSALVDPFNVPCIKDRASLLKLVSIERAAAPAAEPAATPPANPPA
nr:hypothetical protein [Sphingomonas sp. Y57]